MLTVGYLKQGFAIAATLFARRYMPAVIAVVMLYVCMLVYGEPVENEYVALFIVAGLLGMVLLPSRDGDEFDLGEVHWTIFISAVLSWLAMIAILLLIGYVTKTSALYSRKVLFTWFVVTAPVILAVNALLTHVVSRFMISSRSKRTAIIVGVNGIAVSLSQKIKKTPKFGIDVLGFFEDRSPQRLRMEAGAPILGTLSQIRGFVGSNRVDIIFIAIPIKNVQRVTELLDELRDTTSSVYFVPDVFVYDLIQCRTVEVQGIPAVALCETPFYGFRGVAKRSLDIVVALFALFVLSPVLVAIAILVKVTSPGPAIFKQRRYGLDGQEIIVYKFRSMTVTEDSGSIRQAEKDDARLTSIGGFLRKYSLDELPQFINVLQGRMSVVGPRPHAIVHNEEYRKLIKGYMVRHKVTPGITGLAQVNGFRGETDTLEKMEKRISLDLDYLRHWSIALDLRIIMRTILLMFRDPKAY